MTSAGNYVSTSDLRSYRRQYSHIGRTAVILVAALGALLGGVSIPAAAASPAQQPPRETSGQPVSGHTEKGTAAPPGTIPRLSVQDQAAMQVASDKAHNTGVATSVSTLTTETENVTADPNGGYTFTETMQPVRAKHGNSWVPVNTTLRRNTNGTFSPVATAYGSVTFSGGGTGPLATTTSGSTTMAVSWPSALPTPTASGDHATYPAVLPGVDLVLTANPSGGFSDVLVVHDATAARNPALADIALPVRVTGGTLAGAAGGGLQVTPAHGGRALVASAPRMWDSTDTLPTDRTVDTIDRSDVDHAGDASRQSGIRTTVTSSRISLVPDPSVLTGAHVTYPVYLDPSVQWSNAAGGNLSYTEVKQASPCHGTSFFKGANTDGQAMGAGFNHFTSCIGIERAFYEWSLPTSLLAGATINTATVKTMKEFSASCISSSDTLRVAGGISSRTTWDNQPAIGAQIQNITVGKAGCGGGEAPAAFNVTSTIQAHRSNTAIAFALIGNESSSAANLQFSRFAPSGPTDPTQPTLTIQYNRPPNTPKPVSATSGSNKTGCVTSASGPYPFMGKTIATNPPVLSAVISDPDKNIVQAKFQYWVNGTSTIHTVMSPNLKSGQTAKGSLLSTFVSGLTNGQVVDWNVAAFDGLAWSPFSATCHFTAEPMAPAEPTIASADNTFNSTDTGQVPTDVNPTDEWLLNNTSGVATDSAGTNPATPTGTTAWTRDATRGQVLGLDGASGYARTATSAVTTTSSFSVSAWVKLNDLGNFYTVVSQAGTHVGNFYLQYSHSANAWSFVMPSTDAAGSTQFAATATGAPAVNAWTNLIATFDVTSGAMVLYVNGVPADTSTDTAVPWSATGPLTIGAVAPSGAAVNNFVNGDVSDVQVYNSVLSSDDANTIATPVTSFTGTGHAGDTGTFTVATPSTNATKIVYSLDQQPAAISPPASQVVSTFTGGVANVPSGRWPLTEAVGSTTVADSTGGHTATLAGNATLASDATRGTTVLVPGTTGYAHTTGPVLNTAQSFSVSTWVKLNNLTNFYTAVAQAGANDAAFYLQYNHTTNSWSFVMTAADAAGTAQFAAHAVAAPTVGAWTNLIATFDATSGAMVLYVNGVPAGTATRTATPWNAPGPLTIGAVALTGGAVSNNVAGDVSDVQVYDRVLTPVEAATLRNTVTVHVRPLAPGPHKLFAYAMDAAGDTSGFSHNVYSFQAAGDPMDKTTCDTWADCLASARYGNDAIQSGTASTGAGADGADSISQSALTTAGWNGPVTVDGATFTLPATGPDNVLAANETIGGNFGVSSLSGTGTTSLVFLATSTGAPTPDPDSANDLCGDSGTTAAPFVPGTTPVSGTYAFQGTNPAQLCGATGTISYTGGPTQTYQLSVPDWLSGTSTVAAVSLPGGELTPSGTASASARIYAFSVPLSSLHVGQAITSITLPDVSIGGAAGNQSLHVFGIAARNTTTSGLAAGQTWTGSWAGPTEGLFTFGTTAIAGQTYRIALKPSLVTPGTAGSTVRFKFDNSLGSAPLPITAATVAIDSGTGSAPSATPTGAVTALHFGGLAGVTVPEGGMVYSDPVTVPMTANHYVLVSFQLKSTAAIPALPEHTWSGTAWEYTAAGATHAADTTGASFTGSNGAFTNVVTGMDLVTNGTATQVVLGDNLVDPDEPNARAAAESDLTANFTAAEPTAPQSFGTLGEGIEANEVLTDNKEDFAGKQVGGPSVLSRLDRDVLDQPNVTTVILDEGLEDVLNGASADDLQNGYQQVLGALANAGITVVAVALPPCAGYAGGGPLADDPCTTTSTAATSTVDSQRTTVNGFLTSGAGGQIAESINTDDMLGALTDPTDPDSAKKLTGSAASADHANLNPAGYAALSTAYMGPVDQWLLDNVEFDATDTDAQDTVGEVKTPWAAIHNLTFGKHDATIPGAGFTWATVTDAAGTARDALTLDGVAGEATTAGPVIDTSASFSISAWVNLPSVPTSTVDIVSQDGLANTGAALQYDATDHAWAFTMGTADTAGATQVRALSQFGPTPNTWTHLVGTYDATSGTATLYVNGATNHTAAWPAGSTHWRPTGPLSIGASLGKGFLPGSVSDIEAWNYALTPNDTNALFQQIQ
ncbi:MAG TPA: LamG-like jellyroll fold domain-containing protein [Pseudonocardiaceae bacterium]